VRTGAAALLMLALSTSQALSQDNTAPSPAEVTAAREHLASSPDPDGDCLDAFNRFLRAVPELQSRDASAKSIGEANATVRQYKAYREAGCGPVATTITRRRDVPPPSDPPGALYQRFLKSGEEYQKNPKDQGIH
jgi:hypothetical protein